MSFSADELYYLTSNMGMFSCTPRHIATVSSSGQPDVVPVGYEFDGTHVFVGGSDNTRTRKYHNVAAGNTKAVFLLDDNTQSLPRNPRWLRIYGDAEIVERHPLLMGLGASMWIKITPTKSWSFNLKGRGFVPSEDGLFFSHIAKETTRTVHRPGAAAPKPSALSAAAAPKRDAKKAEDTDAFSMDELTFLVAFSGAYNTSAARIATVSADGQPDAVPVNYEFDGKHIYVGGMYNPDTRKYRNIMAGNKKVAFVVDDNLTVFPRDPRWFRIYGTAEIVEREKYLGTGSNMWIKITPSLSWSFNLEGRGFSQENFHLLSREAAGWKRTVHKAGA